MKIIAGIQSNEGDIIKVGDSVSLKYKPYTRNEKCEVIYGNLRYINKINNMCNIVIDKSTKYHQDVNHYCFDNVNECTLSLFPFDNNHSINLYDGSSKIVYFVVNNRTTGPGITQIYIGKSIVQITKKSGKIVIGRINKITWDTYEDKYIVDIDCSTSHNGKTKRVKSKSIQSIEILK